MHRFIIPSLLIVSLAACGGGGDSSSPSDTAGLPSNVQGVEGAYVGQTQEIKSATFQTLILDNGEAWTLFGYVDDDEFLAQSFTQGKVTFKGSSLTSTNMLNFGHTPPLAQTLSATVDALRQMQGFLTTTASGVATPFSAKPLLSTNIYEYDYNTPADTNAPNGTWRLYSTRVMDTFSYIDITLSGGVIKSAITNDGCTVTGTILPRASGKNVYDVNIKYGASCDFPDKNATGIAILHTRSSLPSLPTKELLIAIVNEDRQYGALIVGRKP